MNKETARGLNRNENNFYKKLVQLLDDGGTTLDMVIFSISSLSPKAAEHILGNFLINSTAKALKRSGVPQQKIEEVENNDVLTKRAIEFSKTLCSLLNPNRKK